MVNKPFLGKMLLWTSILLLLAVASVLFIYSQRGKSPCKDIEDKFKLSGNTSLHIYIDNSSSMRGFVGKKDSKYSLFVRQYLPNVIGGIDYRVFGFGGNIVNVDNISRIVQGDFYDNPRTVFTKVFKNIIKEQPGGFIIVSDMVISAGQGEGGERAQIIKQIKSLSKTGYNFVFKGIYSEFDGHAYSESLGGVSIGTYTGERPFYLLIGYRKGFKGLSDLQIPGATTQEISFTSNIDESSPFTIDLVGSDFILIERKTTEGKDKCLVVKWRNSNLASTKIQAIINPNLQVIDIGSMINPAPSDINAKIRMTGQPELRNKGLRVRMEIPYFQSEEKYTYCAIDLFIKGEGNVPPAWIREWSTSNDSSTENYNRTFGLESFITGITNAVINPKRFYFVIENK